MGYFFLVALIVRTIGIVWVVPLLNPEFQWMLLGEKLSQGFMLYGDIEDHTAVFSGLVYWVMHELFGRSHMAHMVISSVLIYIQAVIFNLSVNKRDLLNEKTYVPGFIYVLVASLYADFYTVSPTLLAVTFLMFAFDRLFQILKHGNDDETTFRLGANMGFAFLFYKPVLLLCFLLIFDLLLYSNTTVKRYIISIFGFVFPIALVLTFYYWVGSLGDFTRFFFFKSFAIDTLYYLSIPGVIGIYFVSGVLAIFGFLALIKSTRYINIQTKAHYCMAHWLLVGSTVAIFATEFSSFTFIIILPALAFFVSAFFLENKRMWLTEIYFLAFATAVLSLSFSFQNERWVNLQVANPAELVLKKESPLENKSILVLSNDISIYEKNTVATRFLNWRISSKYFREIDDYNNISTIYTVLNEDLPEVIVDPEDYCNKVFDYLPTIGDKYSKMGDMYVRKH